MIGEQQRNVRETIEQLNATFNFILNKWMQQSLNKTNRRVWQNLHGIPGINEDSNQ